MVQLNKQYLHIPYHTKTKMKDCETSIENLRLPKAARSSESRPSAPKAIMMIALLSILSIFGTLPLQTALNNFVGDDKAQAKGIAVVDGMNAESSLTSTVTNSNNLDSHPEEQERSRRG